ncbi:MAG: NAD-dependent epimerase/dehydratase family protein [Bacteroidota bacterium]
MAKADTQIFVSGGTGLVGSHLLRQLLDGGYQRIRAIRRPSSSMELVKDIADRIEWVEGDILDVFFLDDAMADVQQVYHAAAVISSQPAEEAFMRQVNVEGTANMVNAALMAGVEKFLHVSSIAAIGRRKNGEHISEQSKWERGPLNSPYGISKYLAEQEAWRGMAEGLCVVVINPAIVFGKGHWDSGTGQFFNKVWNGLRFYPIGGSAFVDARDVAQMSIALMESDIQNKRFISAAENKSYQEIFSLIAEALGKKSPTIKVPPLLAKSAAALLHIPSKILGTQSPLPVDIARLTANTFYYDNRRSIKELQFSYTPLNDTIRQVCDQFLAEHP